MSPVVPYRRWLGCLAVAALLVVVAPASISAHSELVSAVPADGTTVPSPFTGPIVLTFSEQLAAGSKAGLVGPDGSTVTTATVDAVAKTMTFALSTALASGAYQVEWTSIADDGDLLRGIVKFTVGAATSTPEPSIASTPSASIEASPSAVPTAAGTVAVSPTPEPSNPPSEPTPEESSPLVPIVIALLVVAAGLIFFVRRTGPA